MRDVDNNVYNVVIIGNQAWTIENIRTTNYNDGSQIWQKTDSAGWGNTTIGAYCFYNNTTNTSEQEKWGALYNWYAVGTGKLAPSGWRVPTDVDWTTLENYMIANGYNYDGTIAGNKIAKALASTTDWQASNTVGNVGNNTSTNNSSGFSGVPVGQRSSFGGFNSQNSFAIWWSSTGYDATYAFDRYLLNQFSNLVRTYQNVKKCGYTVRLVRDLE
jgi:uncharacterized protein (TIGR02145 family)